MFIEAKYGKDRVWLNTDYIIDAFDEGQNVKVYIVDEERDGYEIERNRWIGFVELWNGILMEQAGGKESEIYGEQGTDK